MGRSKSRPTHRYEDHRQIWQSLSDVQTYCQTCIQAVSHSRIGCQTCIQTVRHADMLSAIVALAGCQTGCQTRPHAVRDADRLSVIVALAVALVQERMAVGTSTAAAARVRVLPRWQVTLRHLAQLNRSTATVGIIASGTRHHWSFEDANAFNFKCDCSACVLFCYCRQRFSRARHIISNYCSDSIRLGSEE